MADSTSLTSEPTVFGSVWRYKWLVLLIALAFAGLGWLYASQTAEWTATATLSVQDPRSSNVVFDQGFADAPERYVEAQVAILESRAVARRAVEILEEADPPVDFTVTSVVRGLSVRASDASDIVRLTFAAPTQRDAIAVVNAVATAYQEIGRISADTSFTNAVDELDASIEEIRTEIDDIEQTLADRNQAVLAALAADENRIAQQTLLAELKLELLGLDAPPAGASAERQAAFDNELAVLTVRIDTLTGDLAQEKDEALAAEAVHPTRVSLIRIQGESEQRLTDLQARRDQLAVDADLASNGVVFYSAAEVAVPSSAGLYVVLGFILGATIGCALAVWLSSRRRRFASRSEPELILETRLLADVPNFREERVESTLPVVDAPASASAEAFRFVSASVLLQQRWPAREDGWHNFGSVVTLSAGVFEGKTVITANTALAAAKEGHNVLVVDADFGNQKLTELLTGGNPPVRGMTEVVSGDTVLADAVVDIPVQGAGSLQLL
ncbi:MAG: hypothetical protein KDB69_00285, partial [Acidimicrobiia bacterium]|nr:hypothetical protein [Acidimicrobiia bacterium]